MSFRSMLHPNPRMRRLSRRLMMRAGAFGARVLLRTVLGKNLSSGMIFLEWYES
jgi:hypothetical protein